ncbi:MAG: flavin reductase family protein [Marmoricola sp.]
MTIHSDNPFAEPPDDVRRLRGRLGGAVSLWTTGEGADRVGLSVSSVLVANGAPASVVGLLDPDSDLYDAFESGGRAVVQLLHGPDRDLAEMFGGVAPAPGGPFRSGEWEQTSHGPALVGRSRALVSFDRAEDVGWSRLVVATIEEIVLVADGDALEHRRGRYRRIADPAG